MYGLFLCANLVALVEPLFFGWIIDTIQQGGDNVLNKLTWLLLGIIGIELVFWMLHGPARIIEREIAFDSTKQYQIRLFRGLCHLPLKWHSDHHSGDIISRAKKATASLHDFIGGQFWYIESGVKFVAISAVFFWYVPKYAALSVLASMLLFVVTYKFDRFYAQCLKTFNEFGHRVDAGFIDFIGNAITLITLRVQRLAGQEFLSRLDDMWPSYRRKIRVNEWKWFTISMGGAFIYLIVLYPYIKEAYVSGDVVLLGGIVALVEFTRRYVDVFYSFADKYERLVSNRTNIDSAQDIWQAIGDHPGQVSALEKKDWHSIEVSDVCFSHDEETDGHDLDNVGLELRKGEKIALVGESGSGKSTLMRVVRGLFLPEKIIVSFDGKTSDDAYLWLQNHTTLIPQDPEIFENTIRFNITLGVSVSDEELDEVVRLARFDSVLARFEQGYETDIRERGVNLSGGEKQRLALARGLLAAKQSDIVLLDEPTSSVDMENEQAIFEAIFKQWPEKCFVVSVHRRYLLDMFDRVCVMEEGRII